MLLLSYSPRQQVLQVLTLQNLSAPARTRMIRVSAHQSKDKMLVLLLVDSLLTPHLSWYIATLLPRGH